MKKCMSLVCLMAACALFADTTPVMVSLVTPVQVPSHRYDVTGLRLSLIYGDYQGFAGLDLGIVGNSRMDFTGLVVVGANIVGDRLYGRVASRLMLHAQSITFSHPFTGEVMTLDCPPEF
jgi:hypothetical protein